ncbi:MAG: hypothetical protein H7A21_05270 [Spirochaetales bacterium]|nr:hypothetical protein [Leptospiraceae bacterium]MCP5480825.1 hypothetical protein [Spirochaetales bacterium]
MTQEIFRFFRDQAGLNSFLPGNWSGRGAHALVELASDVELEARLLYHKGRGRLELRSTRRPRPLLDRLRFQKKHVPAWVVGRIRETAEFWLEQLAPADCLTITADLAQLNLPEGWALQIQVLDEKRLHLSVRRADRLYFAGALRRR